MTFAYPFRLLVMRALTDALKTITPTNGYVNDLSDYVDGGGATVTRIKRGRAMFGVDDPIPMISIIEPPVPKDGFSTFDSGEETGDWPVIIQGWTKDDFDHPTDPAHILMADVKQALVLEKSKRFNVLGLGAKGTIVPGTNCAVEGMDIGHGVVRPPDQISEKAYFWLILTLKIAENIETPYG